MALLSHYRAAMVKTSSAELGGFDRVFKYLILFVQALDSNPRKRFPLFAQEWLETPGKKIFQKNLPGWDAVTGIPGSAPGLPVSLQESTKPAISREVSLGKRLTRCHML
jgi:hypothetical protein